MSIHVQAVPKKRKEVVSTDWSRRLNLEIACDTLGAIAECDT